MTTTKGKATVKVNGTKVAEAKTWEVVENNIYFPPDTIMKEYFVESSLHTTCLWKGEASYYTIKVDGMFSHVILPQSCSPRHSNYPALLLLRTGPCFAKDVYSSIACF